MRARKRQAARLLSVAVLAVLLGAVMGTARVAAQDGFGGTTYLTPFPENDLYRLQVYGDSLAEGLSSALVEAFNGDTRLQVQRGRHSISGLLRNEFEDELRNIDGNLTRTPVHIAVVIVGLYDRYSWRSPQTGRRAAVGSDEWKAEYGRRVDRLMKTLKGKGAALYWVGLPIMRRPEVSDDAQMLNEIVRERAYVNSQKFIDVYSQFAGENGGFSAYGPDLEGKTRLLRYEDGMHFTSPGYRKLAHFVEREVRRDLTQAKSERSIPLAGTEIEQRRIRPQRPTTPGTAGTPGTAAAGKAAPQQAQPGKDAKTAAGDRPAAGAKSSAGAADAAGQGDVKADNSRIVLKSTGQGGKEESTTIDIVRPAIPASVVAVITRRESPDRASQVGDSITADIGGGLTVVSSVTLSADALAGDRRRLPPTQTPYYRVLVKGERLAPKPGRADDFSWPKPDPPPFDAKASAPAIRPSAKLAPARTRRASGEE
jgi:hypothetical protein